MFAVWPVSQLHDSALFVLLQQGQADRVATPANRELKEDGDKLKMML